MKVLLLMLVSVIAWAQTDPSLADLAYRKDVELNGKTYELFQTPKGDNVLIGKKPKKEKIAKDGVFLFGYARELLTDEGMFKAGYLWRQTQWGRDEVAKLGQTAYANSEQAQKGYSLVQPIDEDDEQYDTGDAGFEFSYIRLRPTFYRHIEAIAGFDVNMSPQGEAEFRHGGMGYMIGFTHDLIVIPVAETFIAFSMGYAFTGNEFDYKVSKKKTVENCLSASGLVTCTLTVDDKVSGWLRDRGIVASVRARLWTDAKVTGTLEGDYYRGKNGSNTWTTGLRVSWGGSKNRGQ